MASNYEAIKKENEKRFGTEIGRIGRMLLSDRYADRTHFIFELLQNAEDALGKRTSAPTNSAVSFSLTPDRLEIRHYGEPFSENDVRGICGIDEGTKAGKYTSIGRFGIGFKSVYAFTDLPEVHSGDEHFAIDQYVWPSAISTTDTAPGQTLFVIPFRKNDATAFDEVSSALKNLGARTLLFLRHIETVAFSVNEGAYTTYSRKDLSPPGESGRKVELGRVEKGRKLPQESWLVFSRKVEHEGSLAGYIEIAFLQSSDGEKILRSPDSKLVVYFPTIVETNVGFLIQGPYRTTPSRDNVPPKDKWNKDLVRQTGGLLLDALRHLRDSKLLDAGVLELLPINKEVFVSSDSSEERKMFEPLYEDVRSGISSEPFLPSSEGGYLTAKQARLARGDQLRELLGSDVLQDLFSSNSELHWLSGGITQNLTPKLREYLMKEHGVLEVDPERFLKQTTKRFLEERPDKWIVDFYRFLHNQPALKGLAMDTPIIRLEDDSHVKPPSGSRLSFFLPGKDETDFPTVKRAVCSNKEAREYLVSLGLTEPDIIDDVIYNVLPKYNKSNVSVSDFQYAEDFKRILEASCTDSSSQREKLITELRKANFVAVKDTSTGQEHFAQPSTTYIPTQRLSELFNQVPDVLFVDRSHSCLQSRAAGDLLEACGASVSLQQIEVRSRFNWSELREMRKKAGCTSFSGEEPIIDYSLRGLTALLKMLPRLPKEDAARKAELLWEALSDFERRRGQSYFSGTYTWYYYTARNTTFDAAFVAQLNEAAWVPGLDGKLRPPSSIAFKDTAWRENPFLLSKIEFRPPVMDQLASEVGMDPKALALLMKHGIKSEDEVRKLLGLAEEDSEDEPARDESPDDGSDKQELTTDDAEDTIFDDRAVTQTPDEDTDEDKPAVSGGSSLGGTHGGVDGHHIVGGKRTGGDSPGGGKSGLSKSERSKTIQPRTFMSYVSAEHSRQPDPDGLSHEERLDLENAAISFIRRHERELESMPQTHPGYDLVERGPNGETIRYVEVKAMKGELGSRPVTLSSAQLEAAQKHGEAYWLYIVGSAGEPCHARIARIQDPYGKARYYCFDRGWLQVAESDVEGH